MVDVLQCVTCAAGTYCPVGASQQTSCSPGSVAVLPGQASCEPCVAGSYQVHAPTASTAVFLAAPFFSAAQDLYMAYPPFVCIQDAYGATSCTACKRGHYCGTGASTPTPCPGGTVGAALGLLREAQCTSVLSGFWAPTGSASPEPCPASGFYCPGAEDDGLFQGSKPIIVDTGKQTTVTTVPAQEERELPALSFGILLDSDPTSIDLDEMATHLSILYGVPVSDLRLELSAGSVVLNVHIITAIGTNASVLTAAVGASDAGVLSAALGITASLQPSSVVHTLRNETIRFNRTLEVQLDCPPGHCEPHSSEPQLLPLCYLGSGYH